MASKPYSIVYDFFLNDGQKKTFPVSLDPETISLTRQTSGSIPDWTKLEYEQCINCPLDPALIPYCPIALNIADIVEEFKDMLSTEECKIRCWTQERTYLKKTSITEGITSLFGIIMATSDCPILDFLKPMARFHLPFSTAEETTVRATSLFLLRLYFETGKESFPSNAISRFEDHYAQVKIINEGLFKRISTVGNEDADKNAIVMLHSLSQLLCMETSYSLSSLEYLFPKGNHTNS